MNEKNLSLVVGIGASAGGLKPIEEFFRHMPFDSGMAFVVVQHLSPDFKSLMDELLQRHTDMPIHRVTDGIELKPNQVYLIPPKKDLSIADGKLILKERQTTGGLNLPIDGFFASLADQLGEDSVAVVLSGSGGDGSVGVRQVHDAGGLILVQNPKSASFDGMPRAAIKTKVVDLVCEVHEMPDQLIDYLRHRDPQQLKIVDESDVDAGARGWVNKLFLSTHGVDFSNYKPGTMQRRLERRMQLATVGSLLEYKQRVENDSQEADSLFRDLLVEVTHFFRDPDAFYLLRDKVIPKLIRESQPDQEFRAWVCGCATGEEAYSIAILIQECLQAAGLEKRPFRVFATDVHSGSVEIAGEGVYPEAALESLPEEYRSRYFTPLGDEFKIKQELRQKIVFAVNDATTDPPFTKLNLVSCRNLLIYLIPSAQKQILSNFHFGLQKKGVLFLGPSETLAGLSVEFEEIDRHWKVFRKRRDVRLADSSRVGLNAMLTPPAYTKKRGSFKEFQSQSHANASLKGLINRYVPPSLLVDEFNEVVHCIGDARRLLTFPDGDPTNNVLQLLDKELTIPVSAALHRCKHGSETVAFKGVRVLFPGDQEPGLFTLQVESLKERNENLYLISFVQAAERPQLSKPEFEFKPHENAEEQMETLSLELNYTRETLQATVEELESSNEELQSTNEELMASNEELQSTNEELQSTIEELHTVNQEGTRRIDELNEVTEDLELLLSRTSTGILFLDGSMNIRRFTRSITRYFDLQPSDIGRCIENFTHRTGVEELYPQLRQALETGVELTLEKDLADQETMLVEVAIKKEFNETTGVMLTVGQNAVRGFGVGYLPAGAGFWQWPNVREDAQWWSPKCYHLLGMEESDTAPAMSSWRELVHEDDAHRLLRAGTNRCVFVQKGYLVLRMKCADGQYRRFEYRAAFVMDKNNQPKSMMGSIAPFVDGMEEPVIARSDVLDEGI